MFKTFTFWLFSALLVASLISFVWLYMGGGPDGAGWVAGITLALAAIVAVGSRLFGGGWFTDSSGGH